MAGPPKDIPPSDLWRKLHERPRPSEEVDFPRKDDNGKPLAKVRVQALRMEDHDDARIRAHNAMKSRKLSPEDLQGLTIREVYADAVAKEILAMACITAEPAPGSNPPLYGRIFRDARDVNELSPDEINVLFTAYTMVQHKYGPYEGNILNDEELNEWIKRLAEGGSAFPLASLSWHRLVELVMLLAQRTYTLSLTLESQLESLPSTLASELGSYAIGTGFFGEQQDPSSTIGLNKPILPKEPITIEDAARLAERLHKSGLPD